MCSGSNSEIQQSSPEASGSFENETSSLYLDSVSRQPQTVNLEVNPLWLIVPSEDGSERTSKYLLLEDVETGDVLIPLLELKNILNRTNNSRPIANLNNRMVERPVDANFGNYSSNQTLYWSLAFESPRNVKAVVKKELGDNSSTRGHIRIVLLPIIYNIMVSRECYWKTPFFGALEKAMLNSNYAPLLHRKKAKGDPFNLQSMLPGPDNRMNAAWMQGSGLFSGPKRLAASAAKYMSTFTEGSTKRLRTETTAHREAPEVVMPRRATAQSSTESSLTEMEAEVREHKRLFLEQKRQIAEQLARQEALEKDVAALKAMLEKVTRMLLENRGYQGEFPFSGQAGLREASTPQTRSSLASMQYKPQSSQFSMNGPMGQSSPHHPLSVSHETQRDSAPRPELVDFTNTGPYFANTPGGPMRRERSASCLPPPLSHRPFQACHPHASAVSSHLLSLPHSSNAPLMPNMPPATKWPDSMSVDPGIRSAAFNLCNPQGVLQCSLHNPNLVYSDCSSENPLNVAGLFPHGA